MMNAVECYVRTCEKHGTGSKKKKVGGSATISTAPGSKGNSAQTTMQDVATSQGTFAVNSETSSTDKTSSAIVPE